MQPPPVSSNSRGANSDTTSTPERVRWLIDHCRRLADHRRRLESLLAELAQDETLLQNELDAALGTSPTPVGASSPMGSPHSPDIAAQDHDVAIWLLGGFRLVIRGTPVIGDGTRSTPVLRFIVACGRSGVHKERLADQFWPGAEPRAARRNLHQAIYTTRRFLQRFQVEDLLTFASDRYALGAGSSVWRDVDELEHWVAVGRQARRDSDTSTATDAFRRADLAYGGDYLADHPFDDWAIGTRERYRALHREAVAAIMAHATDQDDHVSVIQAASRLLTFDPCDEDACRHLMQAHYALGQTQLSTMALDQLTEHLRGDLDRDPTAETLELHRRLIDDSAKS